MLDVRFHGRGGQGVVTSAEQLSAAAFLDGHCNGCGLCAQECPAGAIAMSPEEV